MQHITRFYHIVLHMSKDLNYEEIPRHLETANRVDSE